MSGVMRLSKQKTANNLLMLEKTKTIREEDLIHPEWSELLGDYKERSSASWDEKALLSMVNAIVFHRRVFFVLSRDNFGNLIRGDKNWKRGVGMKNSNWAKFLRIATASELIQCIKPPTGRSPGVFEVISKELLSWIRVDFSNQKKECLEFVQGIVRAPRQSVSEVDETVFHNEHLGPRGPQRGPQRGRKEKEKVKEKVIIVKSDDDFLGRISITPDMIRDAVSIPDSGWIRKSLKHTLHQTDDSRLYASPLLTLLHGSDSIWSEDKFESLILDSTPLIAMYQRQYRKFLVAIVSGRTDFKTGTTPAPILSVRVTEALTPLAAIGLPLPDALLREVLSRAFGEKPTPAAKEMIRVVTNTHLALQIEADDAFMKTAQRTGPVREIIRSLTRMTRGVLDD